MTQRNTDYLLTSGKKFPVTIITTVELNNAAHAALRADPQDKALLEKIYSDAARSGNHHVASMIR